MTPIKRALNRTIHLSGHTLNRMVTVHTYSNGHGFGSNRTESLSHGLNALLVPNKFNGLVWFGFSINGSVSVLKLGFIGFV